MIRSIFFGNYSCFRLLKSCFGRKIGKKRCFFGGGGSKTDEQLVFYELLALIPRYV